MVDTISPYTMSIGSAQKPPRGLVIEVVEAAMLEAALPLQQPYQHMPWKRAQQDAKKTPGALVFPFARTALREPDWQWVEVVVTDDVYAYSVASRLSVESLGDLAKVRKVGVLAGGAPNSLAEQYGLRYETAANEEANFLKLALGRVDVVLSQGYMARVGQICAQRQAQARQMQEVAAEMDRVRRSVRIAELPLWVATSKLTPAADVERLRKAIRKFKTTPRYLEILARYELGEYESRVVCDWRTGQR